MSKTLDLLMQCNISHKDQETKIFEHYFQIICLYYIINNVWWSWVDTIMLNIQKHKTEFIANSELGWL